MAATITHLCSRCTKAAPILSPQDGVSHFLSRSCNISVPEDIDADMLSLLDKSLCSQCKEKRKITGPVDTHPHLFVTNRPLFEAETEIVNVRLAAAKQELSVIGALLSAAEEQIKQLKEHKDALTGCISQCHQLLSPVRRLPKDVLLEIVKFTIPETRWVRETLDVKTGIWPLSHVCSSWRSVIVNAPALWSHIDICNVMPRYAASILHESINRSQLLPLDVVFQSGKADLSKHLFQVLCSQSERWRSLELYIDPSHWPYLKQVRGTLRQLSLLRLDVEGAGSSDMVWDNDFFAFAPKLQTVKLGMRGIHTPKYELPPVTLRFPMEPILDFQVWLSKGMHSRFLDMVPRSAVSVFVGTRDPQSAVALAPSTYPSITHLEVTDAPWLLDAFTCPNLDDLTLVMMRVGGDLVNHLQTFVNRSTQDRTFSRVDLENLSVGNKMSLRQLYQMLHFITELQIRHQPFHDMSEEQQTIASKRITLLLTPLTLTTNRSDDLLPSLSTLLLYLETFKPKASLYRLIHSVVDSRVNPPADYAGGKISELEVTDPLSKETGELITKRTYHKLLQRADG